MGTTPLRRKLAAILSADMVGFSALMAQDEETTLSRLSQCREIIDGLIENYHGRIVGTAGDSVLAEFASAVDAVRAATEIQDALKTSNNGQPPNRQALFRIGINVGDVIEKDGDLLGDGVNVAARLQSLAEPGSICIAGSVYDQIQGKLNFEFGYDGERNLKNIPRPVHVFHFRNETRDGDVDLRTISIKPSAHSEPAPKPQSTPKPKRVPKPPRPPRQNPWPKIQIILTRALQSLITKAGSLTQALRAKFATLDRRQHLILAGSVAAVVLIVAVSIIYSSLEQPSTDPETRTWERLQVSEKPEDLETFLTAFPDGAHAAEAKARLAATAQKKEETETAKQQADEAAKNDLQKARAERIVRPKPKPADTVIDTSHQAAPAPVEPPKPAAEERQQAKYDGAWFMRTQCPTLLGEKGFVDERQFQIKNNAFVTWTNSSEGKRGFEGTITLDGKLSARGNALGQSGIVLVEVKANAESPNKITGDVWWDRRQCPTTLTRL